MIKCCSNKTKYQIVYDAGLEKSEWLICKTHFESNDVFKKNIETIIKVKE